MARRTLVALVALVLVVQAMAVPTAAQSDDDPLFDGMVADDDSTLSAAAGFVVDVTNSLARTQASVTESVGLSDEHNATTHADTAAAAIEADNESMRAYANDRLSPTADHDVFRVFFHDADGGNVSRYVVADVSDGNWTTGPAVLTPAEFNDTSRATDHWVSLDWYASKHASDEIASFVDDYVAPGENVSTSRRARLVTKYGSGIKSSMWGDDSPAFTED